MISFLPKNIHNMRACPDPLIEKYCTGQFPNC